MNEGKIPPIEVALKAWREAVARGDTELGFSMWVPRFLRQRQE